MASRPAQVGRAQRKHEHGRDGERCRTEAQSRPGRLEFRVVARLAELAPKVPRVGFDLPPGADSAAVFLLDGKDLDRSAFSGDIELEPGPHALGAGI